MDDYTQGCGLHTTLRPAAQADWNGVVAGFLEHGRTTPERLAAALGLDPDFAQGHAVKALFSLLLGRRSWTGVARDAMAEAEAAARRRTPNAREGHYLDAARLWLAGHPDRAADRLDALLALWPGDALAMKLVQAIRFVLGDAAGMRRSLARTLLAFGPDHPAHGFHMGARAFAWGETGELDAALRLGEAAVDLNRRDAWGLHAVAHVHDMRADPEGGIRWLDRHGGAWDHCNNFGTHVWWHRALMHLERGDHAEVLRLYDAEVRLARTDDYRDIANATSLLARLLLEGVDVGDRWEELAALSEAHAEDGTLVFGDAHTMLALLGGGRREAARRLRQAFETQGNAARFVDGVRRDPGRALMRGLEAFAEGDHRLAADDLAAALPRLDTIGGSIAQRDVFHRIAVEAAVRAEDRPLALELLARRGRERGGAEDAFARSRRAWLAGEIAPAQPAPQPAEPAFSIA